MAEDEQSSARSPALRVGGGFQVEEQGGAEKDGVKSLHLFHPSVEKVLSPDRDEKAGVPYQKQGDRSMYTEENLKKRARCKENPAYKDAITRLARLVNWTEDETLSRAEYKRFHGDLCSILLPKSTVEEREKLEEQDWARDCSSGEGMTKEEFSNALFELVDIWTATAKVEEYIAFVNALTYRLRKSSPASPRK